jgi:ribosomal-protein-serine acetyltransferase
LSEIQPLDLGAGLVLHASSPADAEEAFAVVDAERTRLREWLAWVDHTAPVETYRAFLAEVSAVARAGGAIYVTLRLEGGLIGIADISRDRLGTGAEVGYWLSAAAEGRGLMTRTVATLIDLGFSRLHVHRVQLQAATENRRSRAVAERLGLTLEGVRREAERLPQGLVDLAVYSVLAHEWPGADLALARAVVSGADR